jgi:uncharacterized membrane protein
MKRYLVLYFVTLLVIVPLDILWLGVLMRDFFKSRLGDMLGDLKMLPALLFYLMYAAGILVFASGSAGATWRSAALFGGLLGLIAYGTYDLTNLAVARHWSWSAAAVDVAWGAFVTGLAGAISVLAADWSLGEA